MNLAIVVLEYAQAIREEKINWWGNLVIPYIEKLCWLAVPRPDQQTTPNHNTAICRFKSKLQLFFRRAVYNVHLRILRLKYNRPYLWGEMAQGVSCLAVGGLPVQSHPGHVEASLSKTPNPQLFLSSWLVPCMAANCHWCECVCEWVNEKYKLYNSCCKIVQFFNIFCIS